MKSATQKLILLLIILLILITLGCSIFLLKKQHEVNQSYLSEESMFQAESPDYSLSDTSSKSMESQGDTDTGIPIYDTLTASEIRDQLSPGWNLGHSFDFQAPAMLRNEDGSTDISSFETSWGNPVVTNELIRYVAHSGFRSIRIPFSVYSNSYTDEEGNLIINQAWLDRIQEVVTYAVSNHMFVILSHEGDSIVFSLDQEKSEELEVATRSVWSQIAAHFADYDQHLLFEAFGSIDNLENQGRYLQANSDLLNSLNQVFIDTVRQNQGYNKNRILIVGTYLHDSRSDCMQSFQVPKDIISDGLMIDIHSFENAFDQTIEKTFQNIERYTKIWNLPVMIGKFGTTNDYTPADYRINHASNYMARATAHHIPCFWWDDGTIGSYGIVNRTSFMESDEQIITALTNSKAMTIPYLSEHTFDTSDSFSFQTIDPQTGNLTDSTSGSITLTCGEKGFLLTPGSRYTLSLTLSNTAIGMKFSQIAYYDASGNLIHFQNFNPTTSYCFEPYDNAVYAQIVLVDPIMRRNFMQLDSMFQEKGLILQIKEFR